MIKILFGITKSNLGGAQRYVLDLATSLSKESYNVGVVCGGHGLLVDKLKKEGIYPHILNSLQRDISITGDIKSFFELVRVLSKNKPDIFHINSSKMIIIGALAGRIAGIKKIIFTSHGWALNEPRYRKFKYVAKALYWFGILLTHKTICVSEQIKKDVETLPFVKAKLVLIKNGIEDFELKPRVEAREKLLKEAGENTFLSGVFSELHKVKGIDILLLAWKEFKKDKDAQLLIFGSGEEKENLQNMALTLNILDSVHFMGFVENAKSCLSALDLFLMPSRSEGLPYALLEAGLAKKAVIASNVGGIPEVIDDQENGLLFSKENSKELYESLEKIYLDKSLSDSLGENLYKKVKENYSFEKMFSLTSALYKA